MHRALLAPLCAVLLIAFMTFPPPILGVVVFLAQGVGTRAANEFSGFSPSNVTTDYTSKPSAEGSAAGSDRKWGRSNDWRQQAVASVREERQLIRENEAKRKGTPVIGQCPVREYAIVCLFYCCRAHVDSPPQRLCRHRTARLTKGST